MRFPRDRFVRRALLVAAAILPPFAALLFICRHTVAVPFWDDWGTPGEQLASWYRGTLSFAELFSQHNEHRRFFPRLLALAITAIAGWDVRVFAFLAWAFVCSGALAIYALLRRTIDDGAIRIAAFAAVNLLLFSPREYETLLSGSILIDLFVPAFALVAAALINLSGRSFALKTRAIAALAFVSTFTFANGMLVWLLAFPIASASDETASRRKIWWRVGYIATAALAIASYFVGYQHPPLAPPVASLVTDRGALCHYFLTWAGNLFLVSHPTLLGAGIVLLCAALALAAITLIARGEDWRRYYPWLILGIYAVVSGAATARGRLALGIEGALHYRYTAVTVFLYIAVVGVGASVYSAVAKGARRRAAQCVAAILAVALLALWSSTFYRERSKLRAFTDERRQLQLIVSWSEAIPLNPDLVLLSPYDTTRATIHTLATHGALRPPLVRPELVGAVATSPEAAEDSAGVLEAVSRAPNGEIVVKGWARLPANRAADYVVLGYETVDGKWRLWSVAAIDAKRGARFKHRVQPTDAPLSDVTFRAWAIDAAEARAFPMSGAPRLSAAAR